MTKKISLIAITGFILSNCSSVAHLKTNDHNQTLTSTNPSQIEIYSTDKVDKSYLIIGEVVASSDAGKNASSTVNHLKKEAAKLGADAIINLKLEITTGFWTNGIKASGTAVTYK